MPVNIPPFHSTVAFHHIGGNVTGEMVNTIAFDHSLSEGAGPQDDLDVISGFWGGGPQALHSTPIVYTKATMIYTAPGPTPTVYESLVGAGIGGSGATPPMPLNVTAIVEKRTAVAGRKFRGRMAFGGFPQATTGNGNVNELDDGFFNPFQAAMTLFFNDCLGASILPVLLHQVGGPPPTQIQQLIVKRLVGNMRKRIR